MERRSLLLFLALLTAVLALAAAGCGGEDGGAEEAPPAEEAAPTETAQEEAAPAELVEIDYATSFGLFGRDAYAFVALEKGFFEDAGFDVSIVPGTGSVDNAKLVASGRLDYAPADFSAMVVTRANEDIPVKIVSFVHRQTLSAILTTADSGIEQPADLEGRTVADSPGSTVKVMFPLYAEEAGVDADAVTFRPAEPPALPSLLASGQVDAVGQFVIGKPLFDKATGGEVVLLPYAEFLEELPGIGIIATDDRIENDPDEVRRFVGALNRGLEFAVNNPEEAAEIMKQHQAEVDVEIAAQELEIMREFVLPEGDEPLGFLEEDRIAGAIDIVRETFDLETAVDAQDVYVSRFVGEES